MKTSHKLHPWKIAEQAFRPERQRVSESLFSLGNGSGGHRAFFEEEYSGPGLQGCYLGGIYVPEPLPRRHHRVGLPLTYTRMPNAANWLGLHVAVEGEGLDLGTAQVSSFHRSLDLRQGILERGFIARLPSGKKLRIEASRFQSMNDLELGVLRYAITPVNFSGSITLVPFIDLKVKNEESWVNKRFWVEVETYVKRTHAHIVAETRHTEVQVCSSMKVSIFRNGEPIDFSAFRVQREKYVACSIDLAVEKGEKIELQKFCANLSTLNHPSLGLLDRSKARVKEAAMHGYGRLEEKHIASWQKHWKRADISILGDPAAQQGIRFNIFHLLQAYHGKDTRLNISPRGYTGERSGGCTYWSAEAFCLPFVLAGLGKKAARNMLLYRYHHLPAALENAKQLGFTKGAALFPMVTMNGEECHPDWEVAFEAIHRNGAIAFGIYDYLRFTDDRLFLAEYGLEMLIAISRFWVQRVHFSEQKQAFVMHGVTGPNEYENNVNNNWYTNLLARWCLRYTADCAETVQQEHPELFSLLVQKTGLDMEGESSQWRSIATRLFLPYDDGSGIFLQQEAYLEKEEAIAGELPPEALPLHNNWSWDRILRSGFVQRPDVLQGLFYFYEHFSEEVIRSNFEFYEKRTVHESSLSPGLHALLAARLGLKEKAYQYFMRSVRMDLDDLRGETAFGCHVTSMGASWMALVMGFGGMQIKDGMLSFHPLMPDHWQAYSFRLVFRKWNVQVKVSKDEVQVTHDSAQDLPLFLYGEAATAKAGKGFVRAVVAR